MRLRRTVYATPRDALLPVDAPRTSCDANLRPKLHAGAYAKAHGPALFHTCVGKRKITGTENRMPLGGGILVAKIAATIEVALKNIWDFNLTT